MYIPYVIYTAIRIILVLIAGILGFAFGKRALEKAEEIKNGKAMAITATIIGVLDCIFVALMFLWVFGLI